MVGSSGLMVMAKANFHLQIHLHVLHPEVLLGTVSASQMLSQVDLDSNFKVHGLHFQTVENCLG